MEQDIKQIDAECNLCEWKGYFQEMNEPTDSEDIPRCPLCNTDDIYYYNQPPITHFIK
jgi:NAD-dependent SIR2 family protein deacetylase